MTSRDLPTLGSSLAGPIHGLRTHRLLPLSAEESARLFFALCSASPRATASTCSQLDISLAEGNPLFIRELAQQWANGGLGTGPPRAILDNVEERLSKLDLRSLHVLQACALLGNNATIGRVERVLNYPTCELLDSMEALDAQSILVSDGQRVASKHALLSEASVAKLSTTGSRYLH